jgi:hypothetical protein
MESETVKVLLMLLIMGSLEAAIHLPNIRKSPRWRLLRRTVARVWSALASVGDMLHPAALKRGFSRRQVLR